MIQTESFIAYLKEMKAEYFYKNNDELCYHLIAERMNTMQLNFDDIFRSRVNVNKYDLEYLKNIIINRLKLSNEENKFDKFLNNISDMEHNIFISPFRNQLENFGLMDETTKILKSLKYEIKKNKETTLSFFDIIDKNKDKKISKNEFALFFNFFEKVFSKDEINKLFIRFDIDGNGIIDLNEFLNTLDLNKNPALNQDQSLNDPEIKKFLFDLQQ